MKIEMSTVLSFLIGALLCYGLMFRSFSLSSAFGEGQMTVVRAVCAPVVEAVVAAQRQAQQPAAQEAQSSARK